MDKRISEKLPELESFTLQPIRDYFAFDGVETILDPTEEFIVRIGRGPRGAGGGRSEDVCFMHGHRSKLGDHAAYNEISTVCGHSHQGGVVYRRHRNKIFWELNAGWLGDERQSVFAYGAQRLLKKWTLGYGEIDSRGPRFCPVS